MENEEGVVLGIQRGERRVVWSGNVPRQRAETGMQSREGPAVLE